MWSLSSFIHGVKSLLGMKDLLTKYAWVKYVKGKKSKPVLWGCIELASEYKSKANKSWFHQER